MTPFPPRPRRSVIPYPRKSYVCDLTLLKTRKSRTSTAGRIGSKAKSPARRISTKRFSYWALRPCVIARRKALPRAGALPKPAVPGRKTCRSSTGRIDRYDWQSETVMSVLLHTTAGRVSRHALGCRVWASCAMRKPYQPVRPSAQQPWAASRS